MKRRSILVVGLAIWCRPGESQDLPMQLDGAGSFVGDSRTRVIWNQQDLRLEKCAFLIQFQHLEAICALRGHVKASIRILLGYLDDLCGATDLSDPLFERTYDAKRRLVFDAFSEHFLVTRFEDMQRKCSAGKQHEIQGKQGEQWHGISGCRFRRPDCTLSLEPGGLTWRIVENKNANMELEGTVVAITGASMGIGEAIAKVFARDGASVVLMSRDAARAEAARSRIGIPDRTVAFPGDVRNSEEIDRVLALTLHHFKRIDVWVNNAGHGLFDSVSEMEMTACKELFETNFFGALSAMQAVIPVMRQQGGGTIINISSVAGHIPLPFHAAYSASKFAMNAIGKGAAVELRKDGIQVLTVCPGYVQTAFGANAVRGRELKTVRPNSVRGITPERVARATLHGYRKKKREVIVPWTMHLPVKLYQLFPGMVEWGMRRMAQ